MGTQYWTDGAADGNFGTAGNWSGAGPASDEVLIVDYGSRDIVAGMDQSAVKDVILKIGPHFYGTIGTAVSPLILGSTNNDGQVIYNAPHCMGFYLNYQATCAQVEVQASHGAHWPYFTAGTIAALHVVAGGCRVGAATITNGYTHTSSAQVLIDAGATITTAWLHLNGHATCNTGTAGAVTINAGTWDQRGSSQTVASFVQNGGRLLLNGEHNTYTLLTIRGGLCSATDRGVRCTVTNGSVWSGGILDLLNPAVTETNAMTVYGGGTYKGYGSPTQQVGGLAGAV